MQITRDFLFLAHSGYYHNGCMLAEKRFVGTLTFSELEILVEARSQQHCYSVSVRNPAKKETTWQHILNVADIISVFGVTTDLEDVWWKEQQKNEKAKRVIHEYCI